MENKNETTAPETPAKPAEKPVEVTGTIQVTEKKGGLSKGVKIALWVTGGVIAAGAAAAAAWWFLKDDSTTETSTSTDNGGSESSGLI